MKKLLAIVTVFAMVSCQRREFYVCQDSTYNPSTRQWAKGAEYAKAMNDKEYSIYMTEKINQVHNKTECCKK